MQIETCTILGWSDKSMRAISFSKTVTFAVLNMYICLTATVIPPPPFSNFVEYTRPLAPCVQVDELGGGCFEGGQRGVEEENKVEEVCVRESVCVCVCMCVCVRERERERERERR